jgi:hypothetical protein
VEAKFQQEIQNLQEATPVSEQNLIRLRALYLFCGMVANARDISTERKVELYSSMMGLSITAISPPTPGAAASPSAASSCVGKGAAVAVQAYALAIAKPRLLPAFVRDNAALFARDGDAVRCLRDLTSFLEGNLGFVQADEQEFSDLSTLFAPREPQAITAFELAANGSKNLLKFFLLSQLGIPDHILGQSCTTLHISSMSSL